MTTPTTYVVVQTRNRNTRPYHSIHTRKRRQPPRWTLHRADCIYAQRTVTAVKLPAPPTPYPNTIPCASCRPDITQGKAQ